jgi:hypothetical protein
MKLDVLTYTDRLLLSKHGVRTLSLACVVILTVTIALEAYPPSDNVSLGERTAWGVAGVLFAISGFALWGGMLRFWSHWDSSTRGARIATFLLLIGAVWYGAMVYFLLVYIPSDSRKRLIAEGSK